MSNFIGHVKKNCFVNLAGIVLTLVWGVPSRFHMLRIPMRGKQSESWWVLPLEAASTRLLQGDGQQAQFSVRSLRIVVQKTQHFKAITLGEFTFDPDMIASPESSETIPIGVPHIL